MKLGNFVLRCAFLQIFIVFALYSYAQSTNEDVHKYKMIEAINSGNFEEAAKEIINVKDWRFEQSNEKSYLDFDSAFSFINYAEYSNLLKPNVDSLYLYIADEFFVTVSYLLEEQDYQNSITILTAILNIQEQILGKKHYKYAISLNNLALIYYYIGDYSQMDLLYKEAFEILKEVLGEHPDYAACLNNSAILYSYIGNYAQAEILHKEALEIRKKVLGRGHPDYAQSLSNLAKIYFNSNNYIQAELLEKEALEICKNVFGTTHSNYLASLNNLATIYYNMCNYEEAERLYKEALEITKEVLDEENPDYAESFDNLALVYILMGDYVRAELLYKEVLEIRKKVLGVEHPDYAENLMNLASVYDDMGDYIQAEILHKEALKIKENVLGKEHPDYVRSLVNLGNLYSRLGNYSQSEKLYKEGVEIYIKVSGEENSDYALILGNLASVYFAGGDYIQAEKLYKEALEIYKKVLGVEHPDYARSLNGLATVYSRLGFYLEAENLHKEAFEIFKKVLGDEHPDYVNSLNDLANVYWLMGNYSQAELLYKEALEILERNFGVNYSNYALVLSNLANVYLMERNYVQAELLYIESFEIRKKILNSNHPDYIMSLHNLACVYSNIGNYKKAESFFKKSLNKYKKLFGLNNVTYAGNLNNLAKLYVNMFNYRQAEPLLLEQSNIIRNHIKTNFAYFSEKERHLYWNTQSYHFNIYYPSFCYSYYPREKSISEFAYNNAILTKGLLLNASTQVQNAILNSGNQMLIDQWNELCGLRQQIVFLQNKTLEEQEKAGMATLEDRANELDKQLTASSSEFKQGKEIWDIEWDDVKKKLKNSEVAIEFISFDYYYKGEFTDSTMYCALLLRNNSQYPEMITLFEEKEVLPYVSFSTEGNATNKVYDFYANGEDIKNKIWGDILPKLKEGETVYFSPSGLFHQLAIESLPYDENRKMSDVYNLVRLSSTREIVLNKGNSNQYSTATLYGGIHYDTSTKDLLAESSNYSQETLLASRGLENDTLDRGSVNYLPGTKKEAEKINKMLVDNNITAQLYTMSQANEESFKNLSNKHQNIIHIGTHGFTWTDSVAKKKDYFAERMQMIGEEQQYRGPIIDPLNRCGLLFAGANIALSGKSRELPEGVQDGILTAKEISLLDLRDCDLVVLSACETAKGDITSEGVFGLQRAFKMAGVQTIIMSLWKVNDEATQMLMTEFYNNWIVKKQSKREAFKNAQNAVRKEYEEPIYWAGFVMLD